MTDHAQLPTIALTLPSLPADSAPASQPAADPAIAHLDALFSRLKDDQQIIEKQVAEIAGLRKQLADLRAGYGVQVVIGGKKFVLSELAHLVSDALNDQPKEQALHGANGVADSFIL